MSGDAGRSSASTTLSPTLGVYAGPGDPQAVSDFATFMGDQTKFAMDFLDSTSWSTLSDPSWFARRWHLSGYRMIWALPMLPDSGATLAVEATGAYDEHFLKTAETLASHGQGHSIIRIGWEFNGNWYPWSAGGQAASYVAAYRHIVDTFRSVPDTNFTFEWNPNIGDLGVGNLADYYPGDAYVDDVGLDVYDIAWGDYPGIRQVFANMETEAYGLNWIAAFATQHDKQLVFPEWGLGWGACSTGGAPIQDPNTQVCGGDDPTFVNDMALWFTQHGVHEATFWDYATSSIDDGTNPNTAAALKADFG
jgi:Glycosyl hydrolase family 26